MADIVLREVKGSELTHAEVDANFSNLNNNKVEKSNASITGGAIDGTTIGGTTPAAGTFTTLTATGQTSFGGAAGAETVRVNAGTNTGKHTLFEANTANNVQLIGAVNSANLGLYATGGGLVRFYTAAALQEQQFVVSRTASAVNYVQVTGNVTGSGPIVSAQGSDTNVDLLFSTKGTAGSHVFRTNSTVRQFQVNHVTSAVNYGVVTGSIAGNAVPFTVAGSDTNIDLALTPKGTGNVRFGNYTGTALSIAGYIEIKDSGGTVRKLAVVA